MLVVVAAQQMGHLHKELVVLAAAVTPELLELQILVAVVGLDILDWQLAPAAAASSSLNTPSHRKRSLRSSHRASGLLRPA
jgi:hypothetical protein